MPQTNTKTTFRTDLLRPKVCVGTIQRLEKLNVKLECCFESEEQRKFIVEVHCSEPRQ